MTEVAPVLSEAELGRFCELIYARTGMSFGESKRYYVERRLRERLDKTGVGSFAAYLALLRADPDEATLVVNSFTVNETYFYREAHQFAALSKDILPEITARRGPGDKVRIWSLPCSTGEEPYSIAIWLLENWRMVDAYNIEIVGSDIDTAALEAARAGRYGARALSRLPPHLIDTYFETARRGGHTLIRDLRESVVFTEANLVDDASMKAHGRFDVIFCRNVLIYFDDPARARAVERLYDCLSPGGFVCLGHTESMSRLSNRFAIRRFDDAIVYQRPHRP